MEWRAILAVALSIFLLILWQYVFVPGLIRPLACNARVPREAGSETKAPPSTMANLARHLLRVRATAPWDRQHRRVPAGALASGELHRLVAQLTLTGNSRGNRALRVSRPHRLAWW